MTDAFAALVMPIFQNVIDLRARLSWDDSPGINEVKKQIRSWIEEAGNRSLVDAVLADDFTLSKYGLVAWIDEVLTDSNWGKKVDWGSEQHVLEWDIYRSRIRAEKFYSMAATAENRHSVDPLETYLLCVALGFRGIKAFDEDDFQRWIERVYARIADASPLDAKPFREDDAPTGDGLRPRSGLSLLVTVSALSVFTALATLAAYIGAVHLEYYSGG
jgi:type VI secretion system protein ImpK